MNIDEALEKARRILEEEQVHPTLGYRSATSYGITEEAAERSRDFVRKHRPREVSEDPKLYVFESTNFNLLLKIFSQVAEEDRAKFVSVLLDHVRQPIQTVPQRYNPSFPSYRNKVSALALLAEFWIRTGYLKELLAATAKPKMPAASLVIMLLEIEEMIALNFNLFSDSELATMPSNLAPLREIAERQTYSARGPMHGPMKENPHYRQGFEAVGTETVTVIDGITEACRKARYWYLKGALQKLPNLKIESDKFKIEGFLLKLGFTTAMVNAFNPAESDSKSPTTPFP